MNTTKVKPEEAATSDRLLKPAEAATMLAVSEQTLRRWANGGRIPYVKLNGRLRFRLRSLERFVANSEKRAVLPFR